MKKYKAIDIARWFIDRNCEDVNNGEDEKMTLLKLLKLLYYAEGCSLALDRGSLFEDIGMGAWPGSRRSVEKFWQCV